MARYHRNDFVFRNTSFTFSSARLMPRSMTFVDILKFEFPKLNHLFSSLNFQKLSEEELLRRGSFSDPSLILSLRTWRLQDDDLSFDHNTQMLRRYTHHSASDLVFDTQSHLSLDSPTVASSTMNCVKYRISPARNSN